MAGAKRADFRVNLGTQWAQSENLLARLNQLEAQFGVGSRTELLGRLVEVAEAHFERVSNVGAVASSIEFEGVPVAEYDGLSDQAMVKQVVEALGAERVAKEAITAFARRVYKASKDDAPKAVRTREINRLIDEQMAINLKAKFPSERRFINNSLISHGGYDYEAGEFRSLSLRFNYHHVKQVLQERAAELAAHHAQMGLEASHNTVVGQALAKKRRQAAVKTMQQAAREKAEGQGFTYEESKPDDQAPEFTY